jgi:hypothetical protein
MITPIIYPLQPCFTGKGTAATFQWFSPSTMRLVYIYIVVNGERIKIRRKQTWEKKLAHHDVSFGRHIKPLIDNLGLCACTALDPRASFSLILSFELRPNHFTITFSNTEGSTFFLFTGLSP